MTWAQGDWLKWRSALNFECSLKNCQKLNSYAVNAKNASCCVKFLFLDIFISPIDQLLFPYSKWRNQQKTYSPTFESLAHNHSPRFTQTVKGVPFPFARWRYSEPSHQSVGSLRTLLRPLSLGEKWKVPLNFYAVVAPALRHCLYAWPWCKKRDGVRKTGVRWCNTYHHFHWHSFLDELEQTAPQSI